jgi:hypothetical protein
MTELCDDDSIAGDGQMDGSVMNTLLGAYPALMTVQEIQQVLHEPKDSKMTDALHRLEGAGLIHRLGPFVFPTRTAYYAGTLDYCS